MEVLGIRYCAVTAEAAALIKCFAALGMPKTDYAEEGVSGSVFPAGSSWIEIWQGAPNSTANTMLQVVVDDADAFAGHARMNGLSPEGPTDAHGERIYMLKAPGGLQMSFQSKLPE